MFIYLLLAHFSFPYISAKCGIILTIVIFLASAYLSYIIQKSLISFLSRHREQINCNFAEIVESQLGSAFAIIMEICVFFWYLILLTILIITCKIKIIII